LLHTRTPKVAAGSGAEAILEDTILWPGGEIAFKSRLEGCIVRSEKKASGIHRDIDIQETK
jgi:hypothetical protein